MGEKPEVLDAVLKETVDLVMDLLTGIQDFLGCGASQFPFCSKLRADDFAGEHSH